MIIFTHNFVNILLYAYCIHTQNYFSGGVLTILVGEFQNITNAIIIFIWEVYSFIILFREGGLTPLYS